MKSNAAYLSENPLPVGQMSIDTTSSQTIVMRRLFLVTYLGTDEKGDIVKGVEIMAKNSKEALQLIAEVSKSKEVYSAIEVYNGP